MPSNVKHNEGDKNFDFRHHLHLVPNTPLHTWYGRDTLNVTSYHHQGIKVLAKRFKPSKEKNNEKSFLFFFKNFSFQFSGSCRRWTN